MDMDIQKNRKYVIADGLLKGFSAPMYFFAPREIEYTRTPEQTVDMAWGIVDSCLAKSYRKFDLDELKNDEPQNTQKRRFKRQAGRRIRR